MFFEQIERQTVAALGLFPSPAAANDAEKLAVPKQRRFKQVPEGKLGDSQKDGRDHQPAELVLANHDIFAIVNELRPDAEALFVEGNRDHVMSAVENVKQGRDVAEIGHGHVSAARLICCGDGNSLQRLP
jgi:hypothetical protein